MEKKTHIACANAIALYVMRPNSISSLLITCGFATLGAMLPDVDIKDSTSDKLFDRLMASVITIVAMYFLLEYFLNIDIYEKIKSLSVIYNYVISLCIFIVVGYLGSKSSHRTFTHSILGCFIYTFILAYGFNDMVLVPFLCGIVSHIVLDLFNMRGITLFYPSKVRFSFNLCESDGKVNKFLFVLFSCMVVLILILISLY